MLPARKVAVTVVPAPAREATVTPPSARIVEPTGIDWVRGMVAVRAELRDNLASFYFRSGDNGMPWGKWDPQYQPVGVCKVKR